MGLTQGLPADGSAASERKFSVKNASAKCPNITTSASSDMVGPKRLSQATRARVSPMLSVQMKNDQSGRC